MKISFSIDNLFVISVKKGARAKWTIYEHLSDKSKKYQSVGNSGILFIVCVLAHAYYTSLCRGLEYLLKIQCVILVDPLRLYETHF